MLPTEATSLVDRLLRSQPRVNILWVGSYGRWNVGWMRVRVWNALDAGAQSEITTCGGLDVAILTHVDELDLLLTRRLCRRRSHPHDPRCCTVFLAPEWHAHLPTHTAPDSPYDVGAAERTPTHLMVFVREGPATERRDARSPSPKRYRRA